ncbi:MAG: hypothetical protein U1F36_01825 [Planctomycetota bacterium]
MKPPRTVACLAIAALSTTILGDLRSQSVLVPPGITPSPVTGACNSFPFDTTDMRYQVLVTAGDLGNTPRVISGLALAPCTTGARVMASLRIRMAHLAASTLSHTFAQNLGNPGPAVTVLDTSNHHWQMTADTWNEIGLQRPFAYDGSSNLVIEVLVFGTSGDPGAVQRASTNERVFLGSYTNQPTGTSTGSMAFKMRLHCGDANLQLFGAGCSGSAGTPQFDVAGSGQLTTPLVLQCHGAPAQAPVIFTAGISNALPLYPRDLAGFGAPGCILWHDIVASTVVVADNSGDSSFSMVVPSASNLVGAALYTSAIVWDPPANALGATTTNYGRVLLGN